MYITYKRYKKQSLSGQVNIPALTPIEEIDNILYYNNVPICYSTSEDAHTYFMNNADGQGPYRGELVNKIKTKLSKRDDNYQNRWDKIWESPMCQKYKRPEREDYWLWNHEFYNAPICDLVYIVNLIA